MRRRHYSYLSRIEEKKNIRKSVLLIIITVGLSIIIFMFGITGLAKFAAIIGSLKNSSQPYEAVDSTPPVTPRFDTIAEYTNSPKLEVKGSTEPGSNVEVSFNGNSEEVVANADGEFSLIFTLTEGKNTLTAKAKDSAGNESATSEKIIVNYDKTPPSFDISSPEDNTHYYGSKQRQAIIEGTTESGNEIRINDRFVFVEDDGTFTFATTLSEGENKFVVKAMDKAGNSSEQNLTLYFEP